MEQAHAKGLRMIAEATVKPDRVNASALAHLVRLNYLPIAYAVPQAIRDLRQYLRYREWLIDERQRTKVKIEKDLQKLI